MAEGRMPAPVGDDGPKHDIKIRPEMIRELPVERLFPTPFNKRRQGLDGESLRELAESIKAVGLLSPILVRPTEPGGKYEIAAGERRWRAAALAGLERVPVVVRELTDRQLVEVMVTENLQRRDLHPLEEGRAVGAMMEQGWTVEETAVHLGKSGRWVARRGGLARLSAEWQGAVDDAGSVFSRFSAGALEMIAPLPVGVQVELFGELKGRLEGGVGVGIDELARLIGSKLHLIRSAPFDPEDGKLVRKAGSCAACTKRSDHDGDLFAHLHEGDKGARCLDGACWSSKQAALVERARREARERGGQALLIRGKDDWNGAREVVGAPASEVVDGWRCREAKEGAPGAVEATVASGADAGRKVWVVPPVDPDEVPRARVERVVTPEEIAANVHRERFRLVRERLAAELALPEVVERASKDAAGLLRVVLRRRVFCASLADDDGAVGETGRAELEAYWDSLNGMDLRMLEAELARCLTAAMVEELGEEWRTPEDVDRRGSDARLLGVDYRAIVERVCAELPLPREPQQGTAEGAEDAEEARRARDAAYEKLMAGGDCDG